MEENVSIDNEFVEIEGYEGLYSVNRIGQVKSIRSSKILSPNENGKGYLMIDLRKNGERKKALVHRLVAKAFIPNPNNYPIINHKNENKKDNRVENLEWCTHEYNLNYSNIMEKAHKANKEKQAWRKAQAASVEKRSWVKSLEKARKRSHELQTWKTAILKAQQTDGWKKGLKVSHERKTWLIGAAAMAKPVYKLDKDTEEIIERYDSAAEAGVKNNIDESGIRRCCKGKAKTCGGFKWKYAEKKENL